VRKADGDAAEAAARLRGAGALLGLLERRAEDYFRAAPGAGGPDEAEVERLVAERTAARAARDFARADAIRDELAAAGVELEDGAGGTRWRRVR
jgi:cysteinyl-tRNA synthetase